MNGLPLQVAKHGSRSVSSLCGSADVLEALGIAIDLGPEGVAASVRESGVGFMYAPRYHPAMKAVRPVRGALKVGARFHVALLRKGRRRVFQGHRGAFLMHLTLRFNDG